MHSSVHLRDSICCDLCDRFAQILEGIMLQSHGDLCVITGERDIEVNIGARTTAGPLSLHARFSFEAMDDQLQALNLGETVILQEEINPFIGALIEQGIQITGLHQHWIFTDPPLMYLHFFSIEDPLAFARKVALAFKVLP